MLSDILGRNKDMVLALGVLLILGILFAPLPPVLLDLFIIFNVSFALTILLLTFYVEKPVSFSTFPSLLLIATLFRLSLNVAATRLILTEADAGEVIGAIGRFAVQGSFVIGLVVFFILVVVQYVVVTSGAQRVSEVAARFVLDAVPGQQMSIDADLNMGLIDQAEAKRRRKELEKEAGFYGAMDGASKFVKGDAVAGIIILLINIVAGWIIGVAQMGMDWLTALQTFTLLTIGDGIVTQVPALIISVATGIIVTRSAADQRLSTEVLNQLGSVPKIPLIVLGALSVLLLMPGMPKWPILVLAALCLGAWLALRRRKADAQAAAGEAPGFDGPEPANDATGQGVPAVQVLIGREISDAWATMKPLLSERIAALREQRQAATGVGFPHVSIQDGAALGATEYEIHIAGAPHARSRLYPDGLLAIGSEEARAGLTGVPVQEAAFGLPATWVFGEEQARARSAGLSLVDPVTVLMTHLGEVVRSEAALLLSRADVVALLDGVRTRQPGLVEELTPGVLAIADVQQVLKSLLAEEVPIRNVDFIVETLVDVGRQTKDPAELTELVRGRLGHVICHSLRGAHEQLSVLSLDPKVEGQLAEGVRRSDGRGALVFDPRLAEHLVRSLVPLVQDMTQQGLSPTLLCGPEVRRHLKTFTRRAVPRLAVISVNEVPPTISLAAFGMISAPNVNNDRLSA
jgi:flagellar biosynthesis protein FlhA